MASCFSQNNLARQGQLISDVFFKVSIESCLIIVKQKDNNPHCLSVVIILSEKFIDRLNPVLRTIIFNLNKLTIFKIDVIVLSRISQVVKYSWDVFELGLIVIWIRVNKQNLIFKEFCRLFNLSQFFEHSIVTQHRFPSNCCDVFIDIGICFSTTVSYLELSYTFIDLFD